MQGSNKGCPHNPPGGHEDAAVGTSITDGSPERQLGELAPCQATQLSCWLAQSKHPSPGPIKAGLQLVGLGEHGGPQGSETNRLCQELLVVVVAFPSHPPHHSRLEKM